MGRGDSIQHALRGLFDNHSGGQSLPQKAFISVYYWPTMKIDAKDCDRTCDKCQKYALMNPQHAEELNTICNGTSTQSVHSRNPKLCRL
ncbi:hypothetical protein ACFX19_009203 [Malus domestica]